MKERKVLIRDNKNVFFKMFNKKLKVEPEFLQNTFFWNDTEIQDFNSLILVIYNKSELIEFLKSYKKGVNVLICVFNKELCSSLYFLQEMKDFFVLDGSKLRSDLFNDLKIYFKMNSNAKETPEVTQLLNSAFIENKFHETLRNIILKSVA